MASHYRRLQQHVTTQVSTMVYRIQALAAARTPLYNTRHHVAAMPLDMLTLTVNSHHTIVCRYICSRYFDADAFHAYFYFSIRYVETPRASHDADNMPFFH